MASHSFQQFSPPYRTSMQVGRNALATDVGEPALQCPVHDTLKRWVRQHLGCVRHEQQVTALATDLFQTTRTLNRLNTADLQLLRFASIVHDVGRAVCDETHPEEGAKMIWADRALPLSAMQRRHLMYLTLYHRGKVPCAGDDRVLSTADDHDRLLRVLALLRAADGLDSRALTRKLPIAPRVVFSLASKGSRSTLRVTCYLDHDSAKLQRVYRKRKKFRLLEQLFHCQVMPEVVAVRAVRSAA